MMDSETFGINYFNVISDEEYYYVFRALNNGDHNDIEQGITSNSGTIQRIRTDSERWEESTGEKSRFSENSQVSVEEVISHCKAVNHSYETNCISLTSNANIVLGYGEGYNQEYVMVKIPKNHDSSFIETGKYLFQELEKHVEEAIAKLDPSSDLYKGLNSIKDKSTEEIRNYLLSTFDKVKSEGKYRGKSTVKTKDKIYSRFRNKQIFSEEQQRKFTELLAKLTVLEMHNKISPILKNTRDNFLYLNTMSTVFSNTEILHYKDIESDKFTKVSRIIVDMFALVQQIGDKDRNNENVKKLEKIILNLAQKGYDIKEKDKKIILANENEEIEIGPSENNILLKDDLESKEFDIEYIYKLTQGKIPYEKAKEYIEFSRKLGISRLKAQEISKILEIISDDKELENVIGEISQNGFVISKDIIRRENGVGIKISESVNIDANEKNRKMLNQSEQEKIVSQIKQMSAEELNRFVEQSEIDLGNRLMKVLATSDELKTENTYYAEAIVDSLDFSKIYKNAMSEDRKIMKESERKILIEKLEKADCKRLYNAFKNVGVSHNDIAGYVINLLMNNGYKGYNFEDLSKIEELDKLIATNVKNTMLKNKISAFRLDELLENKDNFNLVEGTNIKLRDYQKETVDNLDEIYKKKRFGGVVLPTGAGKSFVAITEMLKYKDKNILYFAPQIEILNQVKRHILKNVLGVQVLTETEIKELNGKNPPNGKIYPNQIEDYISKVFPHLKMYCYQSLDQRDDITKEKGLRKLLENSHSDLMIFDELHRTGAGTWEPLIKQLIDKNRDSKILGITATPIRDCDRKDMMETLARFSGDYTQEELAKGEYLAKEMYLIDAIQDHLVVEPKIVSFNYSLSESEEYDEVKRMYEEEENNEKKEKLKNILDEMEDIIKDTSDIEGMILNETDPEKKKMLEEQLVDIRKKIKVENTQGIGDVIKNNIVKKDGRYIVLLPQNSTGLPPKEYIENEIEKVKQYLKNIDPEPEVQYLVTGQNKTESTKAISEFEDSNSKHLKLLFAIDKLNEGVHLEGINGEIMLRKIGPGSRILYLQQLGRVIYSLDPDNPIPKEELPIVFDVHNNYIYQNMDKEINKRNSTSDLQRLQSIVNWINKHGYFPDSNSEVIVEARRAINLKKIQTKYKKYINGINNNNLSKKEIHEIEKIMDLADSIELFEREIPDRIIPPGEKEIDEVQLFKVSGTQQRFLELFKTARNIEKTKETRKESSNYTIRETLNILQTLTDYGIDINNQTIPDRTTTLSSVLKDVPEQIKGSILSEIKSILGETSEIQAYKIGEKYRQVRLDFANEKKNKIFLDYDIRDLRLYGIFEKIENYTRNSTKGDWITKGPKEFIGVNIKTGTYYAEDGYNQEGYDSGGYKRDGYNDAGYDREGYKRDGYNDEGYDREGYDREKYNRDGYNAKGYDRNGYNKECWNSDGINEITGTIYNEKRVDINGNSQEEQTKLAREYLESYETSGRFCFIKHISENDLIASINCLRKAYPKIEYVPVSKSKYNYNQGCHEIELKLRIAKNQDISKIMKDIKNEIIKDKSDLHNKKSEYEKVLRELSELINKKIKIEDEKKKNYQKVKSEYKQCEKDIEDKKCEKKRLKTKKILNEIEKEKSKDQNSDSLNEKMKEYEGAKKDYEYYRKIKDLKREIEREKVYLERMKKCGKYSEDDLKQYEKSIQEKELEYNRLSEKYKKFQKERKLENARKERDEAKNKNEEAKKLEKEVSQKTNGKGKKAHAE